MGGSYLKSKDQQNYEHASPNYFWFRSEYLDRAANETEEKK